MNIEAILGTAGAIFGTGGVGFMFRWIFKNTVNNTNRIGVLESTAVTSKQLEDTIDKTIIPIREDITQFGTTLKSTMEELRAMKTDHIIEAKAKAMAAQMFREQTN